MKPRRAALCIDLTALAAEGTAPDWVQLLPAGPTITGRDGRTWTMHFPEAVVTASRADRDRLPLDWEHSTEIKAPKGDQAPTAGWIISLEAREGAVWGQVEWAKRGQEAVESKEYRYLSPVFRFDYESGEIHRLTSAGLTNTPNFNMQALNRQKTDLETARNQAENLRLDKFVPRADYDKAVKRATEAEQKLVDHQNQQHLDRTQRVLQAWTTRDPGAGTPEAAVLRQAIADDDWDTVERHGGVDAVVDKIDQADEETAASVGAGLIDNFRLRGLSSWRQMSAI